MAVPIVGNGQAGSYQYGLLPDSSSGEREREREKGERLETETPTAALLLHAKHGALLALGGRRVGAGLLDEIA
ncbi:hypothetical protein IF2G_04829 [Cordyceps javanica]|nr:hypothetical protein IF2G_04829 [Cordyceps javanica]